MWIIGCDLHTRYQQIAAVNTATGELHEQRLDHPGDAVWNFYSALRGSVRVGIEATGYSDWFEQLLQKLGHELWVGDPAAIRATSVRQQKSAADFAFADARPFSAHLGAPGEPPRCAAVAGAPLETGGPAHRDQQSVTSVRARPGVAAAPRVVEWPRTGSAQSAAGAAVCRATTQRSARLAPRAR